MGFHDLYVLNCFCYFKTKMWTTIPDSPVETLHLVWKIWKNCRYIEKKPFFLKAADNVKYLKDTFPGWPDMQIILCTINCHTKKQLMVMPLVSCFFNGHSLKSLPAINLYGQLMTLIVLFMVIQWLSCFSWDFFRQTIFNFSYS